MRNSLPVEGMILTAFMLLILYVLVALGVAEANKEASIEQPVYTEVANAPTVHVLPGGTAAPDSPIPTSGSNGSPVPELRADVPPAGVDTGLPRTPQPPECDCGVAAQPWGGVTPLPPLPTSTQDEE